MNQSLVLQSLCSVAGLDDGSVGDEDAVQELALVLCADLAGLGNLGAGQGEGSLVDAFEDKFVLGVDGLLNGAAGGHDDLLDVATTEEVLDLNGLEVLGGLRGHGEMRVHESHLVEDALNTKVIIN